MIRGRHQLGRIGGQTGFFQGLAQQGGQGGVGVQGLAAAAQDHGIARFQAEDGRVDGHVGAGLVDHGDDTQRHAHAAHQQTVGALPLAVHGAHGVGQAGHMQAGGAHVGQCGGMQGQAVHAGGVQASGAGRAQILRVGGAQLGFPLFEQGGQTGEGGVFGRGAGLGQQAGGFLGLLAEQGHFLCQSHTGSLGWLVSLYAAAGTRARGRPLYGIPLGVRISFCFFGGKVPVRKADMPPVSGKRPPGKRSVRPRDSLLPAGGFSLTEGRSLSYINRPHRDSFGDRGRSFCKEH